MPKRDPKTGMTYEDLRALEQLRHEQSEAPYKRIKEEMDEEMAQAENEAFDRRLAELERVAAPPIPSPPPWNPVFDWYYRFGKPDGLTLKGLAGKIGYSPGTVYNNHPIYKAQYGEVPIPDNV